MKKISFLLWSVFILAGCAGNTGSPSEKRTAAAGGAEVCIPNKNILPGTGLLPKVDDVRESVIRELLVKAAACLPSSYEHDGIVFQNREDFLPRRALGYYHEYTLAVPGRNIGDKPVAVTVGTQPFMTGAISSPRGPERIITGVAGEIYYTPDHYAHFVELRIVR